MTATSTPPGYQPLDTAPQEAGRIILVAQEVAYRWLPYKPGSLQHRQGLRGRWQRYSSYGWENDNLHGTGWRDCDNPGIPK